MAEPEEAPISFPIAGQPPPNAPVDPRTAKFEADWAQTYNPAPYPVNPSVNANVVGNYLTGPATAPKTNWSTEAYAKGLGDMLGSAGQWAHDPTTFSKPFEYGAGYRAQNFERYYAHPAFKELGFHPMRDNEAVYNSKSGFISEMSRAVPQIFKLSGIAFKDMASEWTSFGGGNAPDVENAAAMQRAMAVGSSSKGGVGGWVTNFGVNMGYTLGIMAEMFTENLIMMGLLGQSAFTNTEAIVGPAVVAREAALFGKAGRLLSNLFPSMHRDGDMFKAIRGINSMDKAKEVFKLGSVGKAAFDFANPLEETTSFLRNYNKLTAMKLGDWAMTARGAAALYKDARIINAVASEAKLEGGSRKIEQTEAMVNAHFAKYGEMPTGKALEDINKLADQAAYDVTMSNLPLIFLTDKLIFDKIFEGANPFKHSLRDITLESAAEGTGQVVIKDGGKRLMGIHKKLSKEAFKVYAHPSRLVAGSLRYTGRNLAQGLQETSQEVIQKTLTDYYSQQYTDPTMASMAASLGTGINSQLTGEGLSTFASGFLMGAAIGGIATPITKLTTNFAYKMFNPDEYMHAKDRKQAYMENFVNTYNDIASSPQKYESALRGLGEAATKIKNATGMSDEALAEGDLYNHLNAEDELAAQAVLGFIRRGNFEHLEGLVADWKKMSPEELSEAWGQDPSKDNAGMDIQKRLSVFEKKIHQVKALNDMVLKDLPNPIDMVQARQEGDPNKIAFGQAWEKYQELMIFQNFAFERTMDRMISLKQSAITDHNMGDIPSGEFAAMLSPQDLKRHLLTLKSEIRSLRELGTSPAELKQKEVEHEQMEAYKIALDSFTNSVGKMKFKLQKDEVALAEEKKTAAASLEIMKESYFKYLKVLGKRHNTSLLDVNLEKFFDKVHDYLMLTMEREDLASAINVLSNPQHVSELTQRWIPEVMKNIERTKADLYKSGLEKYFGNLETNALIAELEKIGVAIPIKAIKDISEHGRRPSEYLDLAANRIILATTLKGQEAEAIVIRYSAATGKPLQPSQLDLIKLAFEKQVAKEPEKKPEAKPTVYARTTPIDQLPQDLKDQLAEAMVKEKQVTGEPKITTVEMMLKRGSKVVDSILAAYNAKIRPGAPPTEEKVVPIPPNPVAVATPVVAVPAPAAPVAKTPGLNPLNTSVQKKVVFFPDGAGKTRFVDALEKEHPGLVVEADDVLLAAIQEEPEYKDIKKEELSKALYEFNQREAKEVKDFYAGVAKQLKDIARGGKTVLIGNPRLAPYADLVYFPDKGSDRESQLIGNNAKRKLTAIGIDRIRKQVTKELAAAEKAKGKKKTKIPDVTHFDEKDIAEILLAPEQALPETPGTTTNYMKSVEEVEKRFAGLKTLGDIQQFLDDLAFSIVDNEIEMGLEEAKAYNDRVVELRESLAQQITRENLPKGTHVRTNAVKLKTGKQLLQGTQMKVYKVEPDGIILVPVGKARRGQDFFVSNEEIKDAILGISEVTEEAPAVVSDPVTNDSLISDVNNPELETLFNSLPEEPTGDPKPPENDNPENCLPF